MKNKLRLAYTIAFGLLLLTEICIALYVHDRFVRPYIGDVLVTILICCLCRAIMKKEISFLPVYVLIFAFLVEFMQYFNVVKLLGLENNRFFSTVIGTSFSFWDLVCYAVGCLVFWIGEKAVYAILKKSK
jgi:hypothetical protein